MSAFVRDTRKSVYRGLSSWRSRSLSLLRILIERTRGGGVLIKEDKRMFCIDDNKINKRKENVFYSIKFHFFIRLTNLSNCKLS